MRNVLNSEGVRLRKSLEGLLTTIDVAQLFGVTIQTVHQWRRDKDLPSICIPGSVRVATRYSRAEVARWAQRTGRRMRGGTSVRRVRLKAA